MTCKNNGLRMKVVDSTRPGFQALKHFETFYSATDKSETDIREFHRTIRNQMAQESFPTKNPALSDHYAALLEDQVNAMLLGIETLCFGDQKR